MVEIETFVRIKVTVSFLMLAVGGVLLATGAFAGGSGVGVRNGGTFRVALTSNDLDFIDPALSYTSGAWALLDTTCARLLSYPDKPPPQGSTPRPEVATGYRVTDDAKTFTFTLRRGFRFSDGTPVHASAFARAINRTLAPEYKDSPATQYTNDIVGADAVQAGRRETAGGIVVRGNYRLVIRLEHPAPDFPARTTMPFFCAVPPNLPIDAEGVGAPLHSAGPYYVSQYVRGRQVVLRRNPFYRGSRVHHVDRFVADLTPGNHDEVIKRIESGRADWGVAIPAAYFLAGLHRKYGINRSRLFVKPGLTLRAFAFNTTRPLFRNSRLRRAVNFAVDRARIRRLTPGGSRISTLTDQYLPAGLPGFRNARIYPLRRPNLRRARALARGQTRGRKALIYTFPGEVPLAIAQVVKRNLEQIDLEAEVRAVPNPFARISDPEEPWDLAFFVWAQDYIDPYAYLNLLVDGRFAGRSNFSRFNSSRYNRLLRRTARLPGAARARAYTKLDARLAREAAPMVALDYVNSVTFVSKRVDPRCNVLRPSPGWGLALTPVCLKR